MKNLKIVTNNDLKNWAKEIFEKNSFKMIDVSEKKETFRRALASGKIYVGKEVFELIKNKEMPKGDPITLAEVSAVLGVKKTSELIPLCHPLSIDHTATKIIMNEINLNIQILNNARGKPEYGSIEASGLDLKAGIDNQIIIKRNEFSVVPTGIIIEHIIESVITAISETANVVPLMGLPCKKLTRTPKVMPQSIAKNIPVLNSLNNGFHPRG